MPKRSRSETNGNSVIYAAGPPTKRGMIGSHGSQQEQSLAQISRNITACTICRKHKIKCLMEDSGPPCVRCRERKLNCVLSKNLQCIIDEKTQLSDAVLQDLEHLYTAVRELRSTAGLSDPPPLLTAPLRDSNGKSPPASNNQPDEGHGPSCDNSPRLTAQEDRLPYVPIHSLYALTKMRALRSPDNPDANPAHDIDDFISRGSITLADAERLFALYRDRLDGFIYSIGCPYETLDELRRKSSILSAATLTVGALHDPQANRLYGTCSSELRRLIQQSIFQRRVDRDYLRALSIAIYWLSDLSWTLSGQAIRRATECDIHSSYSEAIKNQSPDAVDCARIWYILYICDQHLALLYSRPAIIQDDWATQEWESFLHAPFSNDQDQRLVSQVDLMVLLKNVRDLFGPDRGEPIPRTYLNQIGHFNRQLDQWIAKWTTKLPEKSRTIGGFPRKGALLHFHFAQLYLHSHVFRGMSNETPTPIPTYFLDSASKAITAASSIIDFIITDADISTGIIGMPSYLLSMTAFAVMFLIKLVHKYGDTLVPCDRVLSQTGQLVRFFRSLRTGKWHLANLMADGLEKALRVLPSNGTRELDHGHLLPNDSLTHNSTISVQGLMVEDALANEDGDLSLDYETSFGLSPILGFDPLLFNMESFH